MQDATVLEGGFGDAPVDAARAFRAAMRAMARPGTIEPMAAARPPAPLSRAAGTLILTLCDHDTGLHLAGAHDTKAARAWIAFHTGARFVSPGEAHFAIGTWDALMPLSQFPIGTPEYPDRSTTLIVEMPELLQQGARLTGPGIKDSAMLSLPDVGAMQANAAQFPLGCDFYLTSGEKVAALPRSTKVEAA